jgi:hypothetical protein
MQVQYVAKQQQPYYRPENVCYTPREKEHFQVENVQKEHAVVDQQHNQIPNLQSELMYAQQPPTFIQQNIDTQPVYIEIPQYFTQQPIQQISQQQFAQQQNELNHGTRNLSQIVTTVGDVTEDKINELKTQVANLEEQLTKMLDKKLRKCCFI